MGRVLRGAAWLGGLCLLGYGQAPNANVKRYAVSGSVYNAVTSEPIHRALVRVFSGQEQYVAFTDGAGRFELADVPAGNAWVSAQRPGYFDANSMPYAGGAPTPTYGVGSGSNFFRIPLIPASKIVGTVQDGDGEPVDGLMVQVMGEQIVEGRKQYMNRGGTSTDEAGRYRLSEQIPGKVLVCLAGKPVMPVVGQAPETYPPRCYPNGADLASAQPLDLAPGQTATADFNVSPVPSFTIRGSVTGAPNGAFNVWLENGYQQPLSSAGAQLDPATGRFALRGVPDGSWKLHVNSNDGQGAAIESAQEVTVSGSNVGPLAIHLEQAITIPIQVNQGASAGMVQQIRLMPVYGPMTEQIMSSMLPNTAGGNAGGPPALALMNVRPGQYSVSAQVAGSGCLESLMYGTLDLRHEALTVAEGQGAQPIVVNLRTDCASLQVTARSEKANADAVLIVVGDAPASEPQILSGKANTAATFANLSPGSYRVFAVSSIAGLEYANPDAMRDLPSASVTLEPNQKATVSVDLLERGGQ